MYPAALAVKRAQNQTRICLEQYVREKQCIFGYLQRIDNIHSCTVGLSLLQTLTTGLFFTNSIYTRRWRNQRIEGSEEKDRGDVHRNVVSI